MGIILGGLGLRIQAEENSQHTPDGSNIDLLAGVYHAVVTLSEEVDPRGVYCKVNKPLIFHKEPQNCGETVNKKTTYDLVNLEYIWNIFLQEQQAIHILDAWIIQDLPRASMTLTGALSK